MDSKDLHYFSVVVKTGSLNKASEELYISRQGLTKIIKRLEDELGVKLFDVSGSGVVPTQFGVSLLEYSENYIRFHQEFLKKIETLKSNSDDYLLIGCQEGFTQPIKENFLIDFIKNNPDLTVRIHTHSIQRMNETMNSQSSHIIVTTMDYDKQLFTSLYTAVNPMFLIVSENHPLAQKKDVYIKDINQYPLIGLSRDIGQKGRTNKMINESTLKAPDFLLNSSDRDTTMRLVQNGIAVSFHAGWQYQQYPGIVAIPIKDMDINLHTHILLRKDAPQTESIQRFIKYVNETLNKKSISK